MKTLLVACAMLAATPASAMIWVDIECWNFIQQKDERTFLLWGGDVMPEIAWTFDIKDVSLMTEDTIIVNGVQYWDPFTGIPECAE